MSHFGLPRLPDAPDDHLMPRDAQPIDYPPPGSTRIEPRIQHVQIRIDGVWRHGYIQRWSRLPDSTLAVWLSYQADPEHPTIAPIWGWYAYDPEAVVPVGSAKPEP